MIRSRRHMRVRIVNGGSGLSRVLVHAIALLRRHRRPKLPVDASALHAAADGPLAVHPAQAILAVSRRKAVAADQPILFVRALAIADAPALGLLQCSAGFPQTGGAILVGLAANAGSAVLLVARLSFRQVAACGRGDACD